MKILVNTVSAHSGGGLTYLVNVGREFARDPRGNTYRFLVRSERSADVEEIATPHTIVEPISCRNVAHRIWWEQTVLPRLSREYDVLFCAADLAPVWKPVPTLVALRNLNIYDQTYYATPRLKLFRRLAAVGLRSIDRVLFPSHAAAEEIAGLLGLSRERESVVHYGIDAARFERPPAAGEASAPEPYVLVPASVERHKNFEVVVDAIPHLAQPDVRFWIAGSDVTDAPYVHSIRERARSLGVESRLRFLGAVDYARIPELYAGAAAALLPSFIETFGHPLLEAMISRTPLVASDLPVFREIAGDDAWYFPVRDGKALASVIDTVLGKGAEVEARVESGYRRASGFTWRRYADELCEVLRQTASSRSAAAPRAQAAPSPPIGAAAPARRAIASVARETARMSSRGSGEEAPGVRSASSTARIAAS
jgi:glycosyltransferase involved in cell wall biosynthesis